MPDDWSDRRDALPQGRVLRDYTIEEVLGHGGFGIVYKARHNELDHVVAIKEYLPSELAVREGATIRAKSAESEAHFADGLRRFREEAKALIEFQQHSSIVDCREFFRANGTAYLVMEYVEGLPLSELLRQREAAGKPFTESDLLSIAVPLAQGLAHIHRAGVIHRDIKPANVLVRSSDQRPVLIDFGAAKQAVAEHSRSLAPYTEGYAALEQVADGQLGPWTDVYGFGAVLWRMVAGGDRPWEPPNPVKVESRASARLRKADDPLPTAKELGAGRFAEQLLETIDECLLLQDTERIRECDQVVQALSGSGAEIQQPAMAGQQAEGGHDLDLPNPVSEVGRTGRSSVGRLRKGVGLAAAIAVAVALAALALIPRDEDTATLETWGFSVEAEPATATVALLSGPEEYRPGMLLAPGRYRVEVSASGFVTRREWVAHSKPETVHRVALEPIQGAEPQPVETPSDAAEEAAIDSTAAEPEQEASEVPNAGEPVADDSAVVQVREGAGPDDGSQSVGLPSAAPLVVDKYDHNNVDRLYAHLAVQSKYRCRDKDDAEFEKLESGCREGNWDSCSELGACLELGYGARGNGARAAEIYVHACEGGDDYNCFGAGRKYFIGHGVPLDRGRAAELFDIACDLGVTDGDSLGIDGCIKLALMYENGEGLPVDHARAAELYRKGCDHGDGQACFNLAVKHAEGEGVPLDYSRAAELYRESCDQARNGCNNLGVLYAKGQGVPLDRARATELYRQSCDSGAGDGKGCYNLAYSHLRGEGVSKDRARAMELFRSACDSGSAEGCMVLKTPESKQYGCDGGDAESCFDLALLYAKGEEVGQDHARAAELYEQACDGGDARGCMGLGLAYSEGEGVPQDHARAAQFYQQACDRGLVGACYNLGLAYSAGEGVPMDRTRAVELYQQACDGGVAGGCTNLGYLYGEGYGVRKDSAQAAELFQRACDGGAAMGCYNLGVQYENGDGVPKDQSRATELYHQSCSSDNMSGCTALATNYYHGRGIGQDRSVARTLFQKACTNGREDACQKLQTLDWK